MHPTGRCLCGRTRYELGGDVPPAYHCHCESCRRAASSPFTTWITVKATDVWWHGPPRQHFESSPGVTRGFCGECGSPLTYEAEDKPGVIDLYAASLDDQTAVRVAGHDLWSERVPWLEIVDDLPKEG
jgi:hypothetical protein